MAFLRSLIHLLGLPGCIALGFVIGAASSGPQDVHQTSQRCSVHVLKGVR